MTHKLYMLDKLNKWYKEHKRKDKIDKKIDYLARQKGGDWSYIREEDVFENIHTGNRVYCYEIGKAYKY